jgi:hypothetical protein
LGQLGFRDLALNRERTFVFQIFDPNRDPIKSDDGYGRMGFRFSLSLKKQVFCCASSGPKTALSEKAKRVAC